MKTKRLSNLRRRVEREIQAILAEEYGLQVEADTPLKYYLDFKTNRRLLDLRDVLERMDRGTFGSCSVCGGEIPDYRLTKSPLARLCESCVQIAGAAVSLSTRDRLRSLPRAIDTNLKPH